MESFYNLSPDETINRLATSSTDGLSTQEAHKRLQEYGPNQIPETKQASLLQKVLHQFTDILVLILIIAAIVSFVVGETLDAGVILFIVVINALMGYMQEARAEKAIDALKALSTDYAKVLRDGSVESIQAKDLVPGDILILESGDKVPADARLLEAINLEVNEAILTGESKPTHKDTKNLSLSISTDKITDKDLSGGFVQNHLHSKTKTQTEKKVAAGDQLNMVFKDTTLIYGRCKAVVTQTGINTEIGQISALLQKQSTTDTPLSKELNVVAKRLTGAALLIILIIFFLGIFGDGLEIEEAFLMAISLAVAAIPEGLPAVVTIALAIGVSRLAKKKAIVRRLQAVETLGSANYILTDKTGTLTKNKMAVTNVATLTSDFTTTIDSDKTSTFLDEQKKLVDLNTQKDLMWLIKTMVICNDAHVSVKNTDTEGPKFIGDSTEVALLELAYFSEVNTDEIRKTYERVFEIPFSSETKKMLVVVKNPENENEVLVIVKGAPEVIQWMVTEANDRITEINDSYVKSGLRSLAFSYKKLAKAEFEAAKLITNPEEYLSTFHEFLGIVAQKDPLRPEVKDALDIAKNAGIKTLVLTGDHKLTATNIASELGLIESADEVMDGSELGAKTGDELTELLKTIKVFARVSPQQKLTIVETVKSLGNITAVTGDGVNDAPAIKTADIGISMGITGTDVSKEVSDMVLQDDNYATIVEAIRQGRIVYDNLVKFITYLISCNISEILLLTAVIIVGIWVDIPLPLLPIQILWINLITDGLPALALGMEKGEKDIMLRKPRQQGHLLNRNRWVRMLFQAFMITAVTFVVFTYALNTSTVVAQTAALTTLAFSQLFHSFNSRSEVHSLFSRKLKFNKYLYITLAISIFLQVLVVYSPLGNNFLKTTALPVELFMTAILLAIVPVVGTEIYKLSLRKYGYTA